RDWSSDVCSSDLDRARRSILVRPSPSRHTLLPCTFGEVTLPPGRATKRQGLPRQGVILPPALDFALGRESDRVLSAASRADGGRTCSLENSPRGRSSAGRASPCQGEGRGFESRRPLEAVGPRTRSGDTERPCQGVILGEQADVAQLV